MRPAGLVAVLVLLTGCLGGDDDGNGTATTARPIEAPEERATALEVPLTAGQCGDVDDLVVGVALDPATLIPRPCDQPHLVEVIDVFDYPAGPEVEFPGARAVDGFAADQCVERFATFVGRNYAESTLDVAFVSPGAEGWDEGDRRMACLAYHADFEPLSGSVAGLGI